MPDFSSFDYAIIRVVPWVEREEFINAGVILFCATKQFLGAQIKLSEARLTALEWDVDVELVRKHLDTIPLICEGGAEAGPIGTLSRQARFHWLVSPRSTIIQTSSVHSGLCIDPRARLEHLVEKVAGSRQ